ncbi:MAG: hypothetical protein R6V04_07890 [bacterium]
MRSVIIPTIILALNISGFYTINRRSHPELDWKQLETKNTIIIYHDPLRNYAEKAATISEATYKQLSKSYDIKPDKKVKIYMSNQDDIVNGYCMMSDHIMIWAGQNDFLPYFTGNEKWLRKAIGHEMSHYFMHCCLKSWLNIFIPSSAPSELNEGYAMYFSGEQWGYGRSDAELRRGVYDDNLNMNDKTGYHYTVSFAMVRYLANFYGEEKLIDLIKYRDFMGLYDFDEAFKEVYDKSYENFREEWRRYIYTYYYGIAYEDRDLVIFDKKTNPYSINGIKKLEKQWHTLKKVLVEDDTIVLFGEKYKNQYYKNLTFATLNNDSLQKNKLVLDNARELLKTGYIMDLDLSPSGNYTVYSRYQRAEHGSIRKIIYRIDNRSGKEEKIGRGDLAQVCDSGNVYYHKYGYEGSKFMLQMMNGKTVEILRLCDNCQVCGFVVNRECSKIAYCLFDEKNKFFLVIYNLNTGEIEYRKETPHIVRNIIWQKDGIYFTLESDDDYRKRFFALDPESRMSEEYITPVFNISPVKINRLDNKELELLTLAQLNKHDLTLGIVRIRPLQNSEDINRENSETNFYNSWMRKVNEHQIDSDPDPAEIISEGDYHSIKHISYLYALPLFFSKGFSLSTWIKDPLSKHKLFILGYSDYDFNMDKSWYYLSYTNNSFTPPLTFSSSQYEWPSDIYNEKIYYQQIRTHRFTAQFPVNFIKNPFCRLNYSLGLKYTQLDLDEDVPDDRFEEGSDISVTAGASFHYDLPVKNSRLHPVKHLQINYSVEGASKDAGMKHNFIRNRAAVRLGYAPFYEKSGSDGITLINKTMYLWQNGEQFFQYRPCIDSYENIPVKGLIENRTYIRGNEKRLYGDKLFSNSLEVWLKYPPEMINDFLPGIIQSSYLGLGAFLDYSFIIDNGEKTTIKTYGFEIKAALDLLGINTIHRLGWAYDLDSGDYLSTYYQAAIPFLF